MDKAGDFVVALVIYAMRCVQDGETDTLARMGFGPAEVASLTALRFGDLKRIEKLRSNFLDIRVDRAAFADLIRRIRGDGFSTEWEHALIRAEAPFDMMRCLFGTTNRSYTKLRQLFGVSNVGRPRVPTEAESAALWRLIGRRLRESGREVLLPADYLAISEQSGVPLRTVWRESKRVVRQNA